MSTLQWLVNDVKSLLPYPLQSSPPKQASRLAVGDRAPASEALKLGQGKRHIVAFVRHCGCPYAEQTVVKLVSVSQEHPDIAVHVVTSAPASASSSWFETVTSSLPADQKESASKLELHPDPDRELYASWGVGELALSKIVSPALLWRTVQFGRETGIKNRFTVGSRYQNHATFGVDGQGQVRFVHIGEDAADVTDFEKVVQGL